VIFGLMGDGFFGKWMDFLLGGCVVEWTREWLDG